MARNRQIGPGGREAPVARAAAQPSAEQVQAEYRAMLTEDLGPAVFNRAPMLDDGQPVGLFRLLMRPAGLFALALVALITVLTIKLWRDGVFESFRQHNVVRTMTGDKRWMLGDRLPPPPPEKVVEPLPEQSRPTFRTTEPNAADPGDEPEE